MTYRFYGSSYRESFHFVGCFLYIVRMIQRGTGAETVVVGSSRLLCWISGILTRRSRNGWVTRWNCVVDERSARQQNNETNKIVGCSAASHVFMVAGGYIFIRVCGERACMVSSTEYHCHDSSGTDLASSRSTVAAPLVNPPRRSSVRFRSLRPCRRHPR